MPLIELKSMKTIPPSNQILAFGDQPFNLIYDIDNKQWSKQEREDNLPHLKYPGICSMGLDFLITGGCFVANNEASSAAF
jgi:hypothetical protein